MGKRGMHAWFYTDVVLTVHKGFYFAVADEIAWRDAAEAVNKLGQEQGWIPKGTKAVSWSKDQVGSLNPARPRGPLYMWGSNSRAESARAKLLGWKPHGPSFWDALPEDVEKAALKAALKA
jgi:hypothetical protein